MKNIIIVLALAYSISQFQFAGDLITSFNPPHLAVRKIYAYNQVIPQTQKIPQTPDAVWIWDDSTTYKITITKKFYAACQSKMTVYATARNTFNVTINNKPVLQGPYHSQYKIQNADFIPKCGVNVFQIHAYNLGVIVSTNVHYDNNPAGLIYSIVQDTSSCFSCPNGQNWNPQSCSCKCAIPNCSCRENQKWIDFPSCDCVCKKKQQCNNSTYYWNENTCSCRCLPKVCDQGYVFNEDSCQCNKKPCVQNVICIMGYVWNQKTCRCEKDNDYIDPN